MRWNLSQFLNRRAEGSRENAVLPLIDHRYQVIKELGSGGMGIVHLAFDKHEGDLVALKTFHDRFLATETARKALYREAQVWLRMERSAYIVWARRIVKDSQRLFLVLEYIPPDKQGRNSLTHYLTGQPLADEQILSWGIQICLGMQHANSEGVKSHRDLKPTNLLVGPDKLLKISDFGLARAMDEYAGADEGISLPFSGLSLSRSGEGGCGTPPWMAPEQFCASAQADELNDIYSTGVILYQMASGGTLPFYSTAEDVASFWKEIRDMHFNEPVPSLKTKIFPTILHCLAKERGCRPHGFAELGSELENAYLVCTGKQYTPTPIAANITERDAVSKAVSLAILGLDKDASREVERIARGERLPASDGIAAELGPGFAAYTATMSMAAPLLEQRKYAQVLALIEFLENAFYQVQWHARGLHSKAVALAGLGQDAEAVNLLERCIAEHPGEIPEAYLNKGLALERLGHFPQSLAAFQAAAEFPTTAKDAYDFKLGLFEYAIRQLADSEKWLVVCPGHEEPNSTPEFVCTHWIKVHSSQYETGISGGGRDFNFGALPLERITAGWLDVENVFGNVTGVQRMNCPCCGKPFDLFMLLPLMTSAPLSNVFGVFDRWRDLAFFAPFAVLLDGG